MRLESAYFASGVTFGWEGLLAFLIWIGGSLNASMEGAITIAFGLLALVSLVLDGFEDGNFSLCLAAIVKRKKDSLNK